MRDWRLEDIEAWVYEGGGAYWLAVMGPWMYGGIWTSGHGGMRAWRNEGMEA